MRPGVLVAAVVLSLAARAGAQPAEEKPLTPGEVEPRRLPRVDARFRLFPNEARQKQIEGRATVVCRVQEDGGLKDCVTKAEAPEGLGFGEATQRLASEELQLPRKARDGSQTAGRLFQFSRIWALRDPRETAQTMPIDAGHVDADGLRRRWIKTPDVVNSTSCLRKAVPKAESVRLAFACRSAEGDRVADCKVLENSRAPDVRYEAAGLCAIQTARFRVEDAAGRPVIGAEIKIPLTLVKP